MLPLRILPSLLFRNRDSNSGVTIFPATTEAISAARSSGNVVGVVVVLDSDNDDDGDEKEEEEEESWRSSVLVAPLFVSVATAVAKNLERPFGTEQPAGCRNATAGAAKT